MNNQTIKAGTGIAASWVVAIFERRKATNPNFSTVETVVSTTNQDLI